MNISNPALNELLTEGERVEEYTTRAPRKMLGASFLVLGVPMAVEPVFRLFRSGFFIAEFAIGAMLIYLGIREFWLQRREFACVTNRRLLYRHVDLFGRPGCIKCVDLNNVMSARLCQTAMAWRDTKRGEVLIRQKDGGQYTTPPLMNGQFILDAIRAERAEIRIEANRKAPDGA